MKYDLYVITDEAIAGGLTHAEIAERAIAGGADVIQLRDKVCGSRKTLSDRPGSPHDYDENRYIVHCK